MITTVFDALAITYQEYKPEETPHTEKFAEVGFIKLPLYGELTVYETYVFDSVSRALSTLQNTLLSLTSDVIAKFDLKRSVADLYEAVYLSLGNFNRLIQWEGDYSPFDASVPSVARILELVALQPDYDPETLITPDGNMTLRMEAWAFLPELEEVGVIGADIYDKVQSIVDGRGFIRNGHAITYDITECVANYPELSSMLRAYDTATSPRFKLDVLLYSRLGYSHTVSLLKSQEQALLSLVEGEFPATNETVSNANEADQTPSEGEETTAETNTTTRGKSRQKSIAAE